MSRNINRISNADNEQFVFESFKDSDRVRQAGRHRGGMSLFPVGALKFEDHKDEAKRIFRILKERGFDSLVESKDKNLLQWVRYLQANLKCYLHVPGNHILSREDYFYGCLIEGPDFAAWLKKTRHYTMQYNLALDQTAIPDEHVLEGWTGYDSFFPESALIHWEEEIDDFPWSLYPIKVKIDREKEAGIFTELLEKFGPKDLEIKGSTDVLRFVKASKFYDPSLKESRLVRDLFPELITVSPGWIGKRVRIQAFPGGGRDGTMATPTTLHKIKISNEIFYKICEGMKNSAMCGDTLQDARIDRVRSRSKCFLHWDFKKVGLMTNRVFFLGLADAVQKVYGVDMSWFDFEDLFVIDGKNVYATRRGYALGWMNEAITIVIIRWIREFLTEKKLLHLIDFIVFNDDVEMGFYQIPSRDEMELIKFSLIEFFKFKDVPCSIKKIFFSKESIFLEDYYAPDSEFDFEKRTIATRLYAKAMMCSLPSLRKSYVSAAVKHWHCEDLVDEICFRTPKEFPKWHYCDEEDLPFESGGWFSDTLGGLNYGLINNYRATLMSHYLSKIDIEIETAPYTGTVDNKDVKAKEQTLMMRARREFLPAVDKKVVDENFRFDLGTDLSLYQALVHEDSPYHGLLHAWGSSSAADTRKGEG